MSRNVLIAGAWRNGLHEHVKMQVEYCEKRKAAGFRQLPYESTVTELAELLDSADALAADLLNEQCECERLYREAKDEGAVGTILVETEYPA